MYIKRSSLLLFTVFLIGCSEPVSPSVDETESSSVAQVLDIAFGKTCTYVDGDVEYEALYCAKGDLQEEWKTPADGWQLQEIDGRKYIQQVYSNGILLLPLDYGSNIYTVIGLDGELPEERSECPE